MTTVCEAVPQNQLLSLAVAVKSPTVLAQTFAAYVGQFYDRTAFDALARQVADLYALDNAERAARFRAHLDRRLSDRYHTPVSWDVDEPRDETAP